MAKRKKPETRRRPKALGVVELARAELAALEDEARAMLRHAETREVPFPPADSLAYRLKMGEVLKARNKLRRAELRRRRRSDPTMGQLPLL